jgi:flagellar biosynthesis protein FliR
MGMGFRSVLLIALTLYFTALLSGTPIPDNWSLAFLSEMLLGTIIYLLVTIVFATFDSAGGWLDSLRGGSSLSTTMLGGQGSSILGTAWSVFAATIFLISGGHLLFISAVGKLYLTIPPGSFRITADSVSLWLHSATRVTTLLFLTSFLLGLPIIITFIMVDITMGLITRFYPATNGYFLAMPMKGLLGIGVIALTIPILIETMTILFSLCIEIVTIVQF